ncbi:MAG: type II CAAX endopeptidase family protein [Bacilli bacterium]|nr:type II CAAX endopeptidase family protein [Bacilli bacterium]
MLSYDEFKRDLRSAGIGFGVLILFYLSNFFIDIPFNVFGSSITDLSLVYRIIYIITYQFIFASILFFIYRKKLTKDFIDFKKNKTAYFKKYFKLWFLMIFLVIFFNGIITLITNGQIANNEQGVRDLFNKSPIYVYIASVVIAPFVEEIVFRLSIRKIFKTKILFIIMSGIVFGFAHIFGQVEVLTDYLFFIPYAVPGVVFAYIFADSDNLFNSVFMHMFHNGLLIGLQFLVLFLM